MGFRSGNILEPSMGVGNFFGMLPDSMADSRLYGVELDSITGRIAKKLYPQADITVAGFETTDRRDFYDLAVGNVPFGQYKVNDKAYNKLGFSIHNYFFAKAIDQVRPGGIVAFVTSRYTLDSKDSSAANTWQSVPICWVPSVCPTMRLRQMQARMLSAILSFCRSVTALRTSNLHGYSWAKRKMALPSTSIS